MGAEGVVDLRFCDECQVSKGLDCAYTASVGKVTQLDLPEISSIAKGDPNSLFSPPFPSSPSNDESGDPFPLTNQLNLSSTCLFCLLFMNLGLKSMRAKKVKRRASTTPVMTALEFPYLFGAVEFDSTLAEVSEGEELEAVANTGEMGLRIVSNEGEEDRGRMAERREGGRARRVERGVRRGGGTRERREPRGCAAPVC